MATGVVVTSATTNAHDHTGVVTYRLFVTRHWEADVRRKQVGTLRAVRSPSGGRRAIEFVLEGEITIEHLREIAERLGISRLVNRALTAVCPACLGVDLRFELDPDRDDASVRPSPGEEQELTPLLVPEMRTLTAAEAAVEFSPDPYPGVLRVRYPRSAG